MVTIIGGSSSPCVLRPTQQLQSRFETELLRDAGSEGVTMTPAPEIHAEMAEVRDNAGDMMAQFGRLRVYDRKARRSEDFERILDSDIEEKLGDLVQMLRGSKVSAATLIREARGRFRDDSDLLLVFRELRRRQTLGGDNVDIVDKVLDDIVRGANQKQIKAGINVALKAKVFSNGMELDPAQLRNVYRQFLDFQDSYLVVYEDWIEQFGVRRRKRIMEYVSAALACDMQSLHPSYGRGAEFGPLIATLHNVRMLSSADELFVDKIIDDAHSSDRLVTEECALQLMLDGLKHPLEIEGVLLNALNPVIVRLDPISRSRLMQVVLRGFASLPIGLYSEVGARHALISIMQAMNERLYRSERRRVHRDRRQRSR
ncbi:type III secretion system YopN/LcrE/InvE/MxiC family regulator [Paraburkholderia youngii]|uniref:type III secretion system gatekeeper subunit SctW n=1 Tax=Paraburkholderia youngii TaxID=2782701 RepID=UPI003D223458